jgi:hypothetical protein
MNSMGCWGGCQIKELTEMEWFLTVVLVLFASDIAWCQLGRISGISFQEDNQIEGVYQGRVTNKVDTV